MALIVLHDNGGIELLSDDSGFLYARLNGDFITLWRLDNPDRQLTQDSILDWTADGWKFVAARTDGSHLFLAHFNEGSQDISEWTVDLATGKYISHTHYPVSKEQELVYSYDFNGDTFIGKTFGIVHENGGVELLVDNPGFLYVRLNGDFITLWRLDNPDRQLTQDSILDWTADGWKFVAARTDGSHLFLAHFNEGSQDISEWTVDLATGKYISHTHYPVSKEQELAYGYDFNGDTFIGSDLNTGTSSNDTLNGTSGTDLISGLAGNDRLNGNGGNDTLIGGDGADFLKGGTGKDNLDGGTGIDTADYAEKTTSVVISLNSSTSVTATIGGASEDRLVNIENINGGSGSDTLTGDLLANRLVGNAGNDTINGAAGNDVLKGGLGQDNLDGGVGVDTADFAEKTAAVRISLNGATPVVAQANGINEDTIVNIENIVGGSAADVLTGDSKANRLTGNAGNDTLNGSAGKDTLTGGLGADTFAFTTTPSTANRDLITDFSSAQGDKISLSKSIFMGFGSAASITAAQFLAGAGATAATSTDQRFVYDTSTGILRFDLDGSGGLASALEVAQLGSTTHPDLTISDFLLT